MKDWFNNKTQNSLRCSLNHIQVNLTKFHFYKNENEWKLL